MKLYFTSYLYLFVAKYLLFISKVKILSDDVISGYVSSK